MSTRSKYQRRHYKDIARWVSGFRIGVEDHGDTVLRLTFDQYVNGIADDLAADNPRFDRERFMEATRL